MIADQTRRISEEQLAQLQAKYNRIRLVTYNGHELVMRAPDRMIIRHHSQMLENGTKLDADEQLTQLMVVYCDGLEDAAARDAFGKLLDDYPYAARSATIGGAVARLTGLVEDDAVKK